jgi:N-glycosylase/DNA lyase
MDGVMIVESGRLRSVPLAHPADHVLPGVPWGDPAELLTPAYWAVRGHLRQQALSEIAPPADSLLEEVAFCLLGGFGVRAELNHAFFQRLRRHGVFSAERNPTEAEIYALLHDPIELEGRVVRYRYPSQRARRLAQAVPEVRSDRFRTDNGQQLRRELLTLTGVGPKTASWIVRNWLAANDVAIIDIHVIRACQVMGVFPRKIRLPSDYSELEAKFLRFAQMIGVPASILDAVMWSEMRSFPSEFVAQLT